MDFKTFAATYKLKSILDRALFEAGYDPDFEHEISIHTKLNGSEGDSISIVIKPRINLNPMPD